MLYFLILILVGSSTYLLVSNLVSLRRRNYWPFLADALPAADYRKALHSHLDKFINPLLPYLKPVINLPYLRKLQDKLDVLRVNVNMVWIILLKLIMMIIAGGLFWRLYSPLHALLGVVVAFFLPDVILLLRIQSKKEEIRKGFPEAIDLLDLCIGAGLDFSTAVRWVIDKSEFNAFVEQLQVVLSEIRVGKSQVQALKDMARRLNLYDISSFVRSVVQAENMGTPLEEAFNNLSEDTRMARFQAGERYAIKASLKILFPLLFCILPVIMIVVAGPVIIKFTQGGFIPGGAMP